MQIYDWASDVKKLDSKEFYIQGLCISKSLRLVNSYIRTYVIIQYLFFITLSTDNDVGIL